MWDVLDFRKKQGKQTDLLKTNKLPWLLEWEKKKMSAEKRVRLKGKDKQ